MNENHSGKHGEADTTLALHASHWGKDQQVIQICMLMCYYYNYYYIINIVKVYFIHVSVKQRIVKKPLFLTLFYVIVLFNHYISICLIFIFFNSF